MSTAALAYQEPSIVTILVGSSFLLLLNVVNSLLDRLIYCGLLGQVFIGVAWGVPGAGWLSLETQNVVTQLGYLGLVLVVYQGGLSTDFVALKANIVLSTMVALVGISVPIALSFVLQRLLDITALQAFAAGAALCSTSLGTTFTILSTTGLVKSRLGVVLTSAALMDDVVGLVMVQVVASLRGDSASLSAVTVIRPVLVSVAFAVVVPLICRFVVQPMTARCRQYLERIKFRRLCTSKESAFLLHNAILIALVTGSSYAGTSNLFAAYLAGASISWWDSSSAATIQDRRMEYQKHQDTPSSNTVVAMSNIVKQPNQSDITQRDTDIVGATIQAAQRSLPTVERISGVQVYNSYYGPAVERILKPFFFASIGFSIPITSMFAGPVAWRGIVYSILMMLGKVACGLCLVRFSSTVDLQRAVKRTASWPVNICWPIGVSRSIIEKRRARPSLHGSARTPLPASHDNRPGHSKRSRQLKPKSLYPAAILGSAMIARGEIGFLISAIAESNGVFAGYHKIEEGQSSQLFLVVTWAILLCTVVGPVSVGLLVRHVKRLQAEQQTQKTSKGDPVGIWGVLPMD